jgi:hypothetical protein
MLNFVAQSIKKGVSKGVKYALRITQNRIIQNIIRNLHAKK